MKQTARVRNVKHQNDESNQGLNPGPHVGRLSPFTANAWWFSPLGFLPPSEGLEIVLIGTVS